MNTFCPTTIGLELPSPSSGTFHFTFSVCDQESGSVCSSDCPVPSGPRQCSQSAAAENDGRNAGTKQTKKARGAIIGGNSGGRDAGRSDFLSLPSAGDGCHG